jgi:hypothetical protein
MIVHILTVTNSGIPPLCIPQIYNKQSYHEHYFAFLFKQKEKNIKNTAYLFFFRIQFMNISRIAVMRAYITSFCTYLILYTIFAKANSIFVK